MKGWLDRNLQLPCTQAAFALAVVGMGHSSTAGAPPDRFSQLLFSGGRQPIWTGLLWEEHSETTVLQIQFLSTVTLSSDLLMANKFRAATMQWHYCVMEISTGSEKIKSFWERKKEKTEKNMRSCWRNGEGWVLSSPHINVIFITSAQIIPHDTPVLTMCSANSMDIQRFMDISHCQRPREMICFMRPVSGEKTWARVSLSALELIRRYLFNKTIILYCLHDISTTLAPIETGDPFQVALYPSTARDSSLCAYQLNRQDVVCPLSKWGIDTHKRWSNLPHRYSIYKHRHDSQLQYWTMVRGLTTQKTIGIVYCRLIE